MLTEEICDTKLSLSKLHEKVVLYPQITKNLHVKNKSAVISDEVVKEKIKEVEKLIDKKGRVLLRESGTEPVVRIMVECDNRDMCNLYVDMISNVITERGYLNA
jgi:phosphoglucosamine mutase